MYYSNKTAAKGYFIVENALTYQARWLRFHTKLIFYRARDVLSVVDSSTIFINEMDRATL